MTEDLFGNFIPEAHPEIDSIVGMLKCAAEFNLEPEVIWSAMRYLQENAGVSIEEACSVGVLEWIK